MHVICVEPAPYTLDLLKNIYGETSITFLHSNSKAVWTSDSSIANAYYCDNNSWLQNLCHFIQIGLNNRFIISNGYTHWSFQLLYLMSFFKKMHIGIESDTPYSEKVGVKKIIKTLYLGSVFSNKAILGLSGGNGAHMDLFLKYGMDKHRIFLLPMMIDNLKYFRPEKRDSNKSFSFLCVGRLIPEKNIEMLLDAFKNKFMNSNTQLIIVGSGMCEDALKNRSDSAENIVFKGKLIGEELITCYHHADVLVLPSVSEKWGLVVNEALASRLAVLCSNAVGAASDLVIKPDAGWVFNTGNQDELERLLIHCVEHREEVEEKAKNGLAFMKNNWSYKNYQHSLDEIKNYVTTH